MHLGGMFVYVTLGGLCLVAGQDKVCLGTDYPFPLGEYSAESKGTDYVPGHLIDSMDWDEPLRRQVLVSTALYQQCGGARRVVGWLPFCLFLCVGARKQGTNAMSWLGVDEKRFLVK